MLLGLRTSLFNKLNIVSSAATTSWRSFTSSSAWRRASSKPIPTLLDADDTNQDFAVSLNPYIGRSIGNVSNPNTAYRKLNSILAQNNVRKEKRASRYYEKPTVARRRIKIERNRKLFGALVRKKVALIMQMKQRGM